MLTRDLAQEILNMMLSIIEMASKISALETQVDCLLKFFEDDLDEEKDDVTINADY
jgi:hypothetical protein